MRKFYFLSLFFFMTIGLTAQIVPISNSSINTCEGIFTDTGKKAGAYSPNENYTFTICPGSQGGNIRLSFTKSAFRPGDFISFYDGTSSNEPLLTTSANFSTEEYIIQATGPTGCLTSVFVSNSYQEGDGWEAQISCTPICQAINAEITSSSPSIKNNKIDICIGSEVEFNANALFINNDQNYHQDVANCTFEWNFGNGLIQTGQNITQQFDVAGGTAISLKVIDQYGCESTNSLGISVRIAEKPSLSLATTSIPNICANEEFNLSASLDDATTTVKIEQADGGYSLIKSHSDSLALPDGNGASYVSTIFYNEFDAGQTLTNEAELKRVFVNMEHSWLRDLEISIECPNGQKTVLSHHPGNTGGEVFLGEPNEIDEALTSPIPGVGYDYAWSSTAQNPNWIDYVNQNLPATLPTGEYTPSEPLSQLVGCPLNGDWKIEVTDLWASDNGFIFSWGLEFDEALYPSGETFTPSISDIHWIDNTLINTDHGNNVDAISATAGKKNFQIEVSNDFGCTSTTEVLVNVLPPTSPDCYNCSSFKAALNDTAICLGQDINYDATFNKDLIKSLEFEAIENRLLDSPTFSSTLTISDVNPAIIGSVAYRIDSIEMSFTSGASSELSIYLQSPSGKKLLIGSSIYVSGHSTICLKPNAINQVTAAPFSGSYKPDDAWSKLQSEPTNGDWKLLVSTKNNVPTTLNSWKIAFKNDVSIGYHWTGNGLSCTDCPTPLMTPTSSGQYIVEVYDNLNCAYNDTVNVTIIEALSPPVIMDPEYIDGQIIFKWLPVQNADSYLVKINNTNWITPNGTLSQTLDGYILGDEINFKVKALSASGCDGSDANLQLKITNCLLVSNHTVVKAPACIGVNDGEIQLSASNGTPPIQFSLDGSSAQSSNNYTGLAAGNHFAIVSDAAGCADTIVFTINPAKNLILNISTTDITCNGDNNGTATANITGGPAMPLTYNWITSPIQNTPSINALSKGNYDLFITDADGCQLNGTATITEPNALSINFENINNISCFGLTDGSATAKPVGGSAPYTFAWSDGTTSETILNKPAGNYQVTVTDLNGCTSTNSINITQPTTSLAIIANQSVKACAYTNNNKANATASGGKTPYSYVWSNGQNNAIANHLTPGNYSVTTTDANGCQASTNIAISEYEPVVLTLDFTEPKCNGGSDGTVNIISIQGGNSTDLADYSYAWLNQPDTDASLENIVGDKSYYVTATGTTGCKGTTSILVTEPAPIDVALTATPVTCAGDQDGTVTVADITGNVGPFSIQWDSKAGASTLETVNNLSGDLYNVTVTNPNGCTGSSHVQVKEAPSFIINKVVTRHPNCAGENNGTITLDLEGGAQPYQYTWSDGSTENNINNAVDGTYAYTVTDANGCAINDVAILQDPPPVIATSVAQAPICFEENNGSITITATGGSQSYEYSLNNTSFDANNVLEGMSAGVYPIYVKDEKGCLFIDTVTLIQPPLFSLDAGPNLQLSYAEITEISIEASNATGDINIMVIDPLAGITECYGCYDININPKYHGVYQIVATDEKGCIARDEIDIAITRDQQFLVPTAFTPNGDGINDFLTCHTKNEAKVNFFRVFDRWGGLIYEKKAGISNQPNAGWDGYAKGKKMSAGTYIWTASVSFDNGEKTEFKGQTTLIR